MRIVWSERKRAQNLREHGLDFEHALALFLEPHFVWADIREDYGEERWNAIGQIKGRTVVASFTYRRRETIRLISLRKATPTERRLLETGIED